MNTEASASVLSERPSGESEQRSRRLPREVLRRTELIARMEELERILRATGEADLQKLHALQSSIRYWADRTSHVGRLQRFAGMLSKAGDTAGALDLLQFAHGISPGHARTAAVLSEMLAASGRILEAVQIILVHAGAPDAEVQVLLAAARAHHKMGDWERGNQFFGRAVQKDPSCSWEFLDALTRSGRREEGLKVAERVLRERPEDLRTCFACYAAFLRLGAEAVPLGRARDRLFEQARRKRDGAIWRARALRLEGDIEAGLNELCAAPVARLDDPKLVRERAVFALAAGNWGRDAGLLCAARHSADRVLAENIEQTDLLLRACGTSLEKAASDPYSSAHVKSPESVFEIVTAAARPPAVDRRGLVMIVPSLAGGGAERIVATSFGRWSRDERFGGAKLYVSDLDREEQADFYLPLTGIQRSDIVLLEREERPEPPWVWLGSARGKRAQSIYRHLTADRPRIVHATLDLLNSGLAAVAAGVPRIVLHIHNMRPSELGARDSERLRECYRALLRCPEVSVIGCAQACVDDHIEWLGLTDTGKIYTVHNGVDVGAIVAAGGPDARTAQRRAVGLSPDDTVVGTAFRFAELKRPFLWVDAATRILSERPDCKFVMFGDGELRGAVQQYIRERELSENFVLPGRVTDLPQRLGMLDLFVFSSRTEALPNVLLEAQAAGVPVIAFDVGGISEAVLDGISGWLVRENTAEALGDRVLTALSAPDWRHRASEAAQKFVRDNFGIDRMLQSISSILLQSA